jgi:predicted NACHT family NTPase
MTEPTMSQSNSDDSKGFQIVVGDGGTAYNAGQINIYNGALPSTQAELPDVAPYLNQICEHYQKWQTLYTLTDVEGKEKLQNTLSNQSGQWESPFDFGLKVQTAVKTREQNREAREEAKEKIERFPVLEGICKYAKAHVLLVGRPGSGKSTALAKLALEEALQQGSIPVLVELRFWQGSIAALIANVLGQNGLVLTDEQLPLLWQDQRLLLLFDGLNELPSEEARSQLMAFRQNHRNIPMIFTTRDLSKRLCDRIFLIWRIRCCGS